MKNQNSNVDIWLKICNEQGIRTLKSRFIEYKDINKLIEQLSYKNWAEGVAMYHKDFCFVNQVEGGSEFMQIYDNHIVDSISCARYISEHGEGNFKKEFIFKLLNTNDTIASCLFDVDGNPTYDLHKGEIYKGYGITSWLSAGEMRSFVIHLGSGLILPLLVENADIPRTKKEIDEILEIVNPDMDYDEICAKLIHR